MRIAPSRPADSARTSWEIPVLYVGGCARAWLALRTRARSGRVAPESNRDPSIQDVLPFASSHLKMAVMLPVARATVLSAAP